MIGTLVAMQPKKSKRKDRSAEEVAARELVAAAKAQGLWLTGPDGMLKQFTKTVLETALNEEMVEHLGHQKHQSPSGVNIRNGTRAKAVLTEATGQVVIEVPRDRGRELRTGDRAQASTPSDRGG
jgi:putative transposase